MSFFDPECLMALQIERIRLVCMLSVVLMCNGARAAVLSESSRLEVRSSSATEVLTITPAKVPSADSFSIHFEHRT
jgi:hypothetical protein